jgi:RNA polymerase sigma-70 factor (ECF subfamily)
MTRSQDDDKLNGYLDLARLGDQAGFTGLYRVLSGRVAGFLRGRGVDDTDEVVNDVFLGAFRNLHTFEGEAAHFRSWLFGIAFNKAMDRHRSAQRRPRTVALDTTTTERLAVEGRELDWSGDDNVSQLLSLLSSDQRDVLLLRIVADLSLAETAETLGKPAGAIKSLQHRALATLARISSEQAVSQSDSRATTESR